MENKKKSRTKEIVVAALVAAVIGVIYTVLDYFYMPMSAVLGPIFMEITFGIYLLSAFLPMYIVRKPGFAIYGAILTAVVNLLLGSPYGVQVILAGVLQAVGIEIGFALSKYKVNAISMIVGPILASLLVFVRDYFVFGYSQVATSVLIGIVVVRVISALVIGGLLVCGITSAVKKTGTLKGFRCSE
ncbi:MAG: hypothetical protein GX852_05220 [Clostridiales bacterium]|nr:hypothetical protein [Clostridiales bacterium]